MPPATRVTSRYHHATTKAGDGAFLQVTESPDRFCLRRLGRLFGKGSNERLIVPSPRGFSGTGHCFRLCPDGMFGILLTEIPAQRVGRINGAKALFPTSAEFIRFIAAGLRHVASDALATDPEMAAVQLQRHGLILSPIPTLAHGF